MHISLKKLLHKNVESFGKPQDSIFCNIHFRCKKSLESSFETTRKKLLVYYCRNVRAFLSYFRQCQVASVKRLDQLLKFDIKNRQQKQWFTKNDSCRCFLGKKHEILHHCSHMPVRYDCRDCQYLAIPEMLQSHKTDTVCKCMFWDIGEPKIKTSSQSPL